MLADSKYKEAREAVVAAKAALPRLRVTDFGSKEAFEEAMQLRYAAYDALFAAENKLIDLCYQEAQERKNHAEVSKRASA